MNRYCHCASLSLLALAACAAKGAAPGAAAPPPAEFVAAAIVPEPAAPPAMPPPPAPPEDPGPAAPLEHGAREEGAPRSRVEAANRAALREPGRSSYANAAQIYPWSEGALYRLYTAPGRVSDIALQAGETLISVAAGDTARWVIGDTASGSGASRRTHILVKPTAAGLRTNLVVATDRRVYHLQLESTARTAMASVSWTYPADELLAVRREAAAIPVAAGVALDELNFGYSIDGDDPPWRPLRAFDDGRQVFIEFPAGIASGEAPPLFVRGPKGRAELVNYRVRGRFYVVDRLFEAAELRLGEKRQQVVRIVRDREGGGRRREPRS